ncbi:GNAT family N-acetyltransferase [Aureimonas sp. AU4]|uniref:GNAT family N-acetyltransferase n=1 Tax=Aureimonas sp. AU4 TaxID=1638163 RepID=UPI00070587A5|nr:GNAT family N-acetyltransferase [Aureimonas sp. AU4]BAT30716.1 putative acetyl transferase [Aureimonas sp. AU4]
MTPVFLRTGGKADLARVSRLLGETWHATYDGIYGSDRVEQITAAWHTPSRLAGHLARPSSEFVVADDGSRLLGMAYAAAADGKLVALHQLYVLPEAQGRGIGSDLLAEIKNAFPDARRIRLEVELANAGALRFYERRGFAVTGPAAAPSETAGIDLVVMEKRLA